MRGSWERARSVSPAVSLSDEEWEQSHLFHDNAKWITPMGASAFRYWATEVWRPKSKSMDLMTVNMDFMGAKCAAVQEHPQIYLMALGPELHGTGTLRVQYSKGMAGGTRGVVFENVPQLHACMLQHVHESPSGHAAWHCKVWSGGMPGSDRVLSSIMHGACVHACSIMPITR